MMVMLPTKWEASTLMGLELVVCLMIAQEGAPWRPLGRMPVSRSVP